MRLLKDDTGNWPPRSAWIALMAAFVSLVSFGAASCLALLEQSAPVGPFVALGVWATLFWVGATIDLKRKSGAAFPWLLPRWIGRFLTVRCETGSLGIFRVERIEGGWVSGWYFGGSIFMDVFESGPVSADQVPDEVKVAFETSGAELVDISVPVSEWGKTVAVIYVGPHRFWRDQTFEAAG